MEPRLALCLVLAVVAGVPTQTRVHRSTAVSGAEGELLDYLQKERSSFGGPTHENSYADHSKEKCHNRNLRLCGKPALEKLQKEKEVKRRCLIREEFLTCMSRQRTQACVPESDAQEEGSNSPDISRLRSELRKNFHNCVLSYTIPDQSLSL